MQVPTLVIGNKNYSSWSLRPWLFLRKNGIEFSQRQLWLDEPGFKSAVDDYNSGGKVPVLLDGQLQIWDSLAIIEYAMETYDCRHGWPMAAALRAHARASVCEMHSGFLALRSECPMDVRTTRSIDLSDAAAQDIQRVCELWSQALSRSHSEAWLYGDFSVADAFYAPVVFRFNSYGIEVTPRIRAYMDFVLEDSAVVEWAADARREKHQIDY